MANTWKGQSGGFLPLHFDEKKLEGSDPALQYEVRRVGDKVEFSLVSGNATKATLPVEVMVGGKRHGISFLVRLSSVDDIPLTRSALIESRYALSPHGSLVLSPGFEKERPNDFEDSLGRVLSPAFEKRCLTCHGQPGTLLGASPHGGVGCQSCHGPARSHVDSMQAINRQQTPVKPETLTGEKALAVCAQCHMGLSTVNHADPLPQDVLVSSQVPAMVNSECFKQSGGVISCTDCHDPHQDSPKVAERSEKTCLRCHSFSVQRHASICPVNANSQCLTCHMPGIESNGFRLTDHWIRVHPEQGVKAGKPDDSLKSQVIPKREYLQIIVSEDAAKAETAERHLRSGGAFYDIAHDLSSDPTAAGGGFIGEMQLSDMDGRLAEAAGHLSYGETSGIVNLGNRYVLLHRLPRNFKQDANKLYEEAVELRSQGNRVAAIETDQAALKIYPYFLRALVFLGAGIGEAGEAQRASEVLGFAVQSYPQDASTQFDLGLSLGAQPTAQMQAFRRAIELDPDMVAAYESLGAALASGGKMTEAIDVFRRGLEIDPLSAILNYDLGLALKATGDEARANQTLALAAKLDPTIQARLQKRQ